MAICVDCEREMTTAASCTVTTLHLGDLPFPMARHRRGGDGRCGDCGVEPGGYHHLGCDLAGCPRCGRQLISCGCPFDELDDGWEGDLDDEDDIDGDDDEEADGFGTLAWRQVCPRCGSGSVIPILYGISNPTAQALVDHGVLELGDPTAPAAVTDPTGATGDARPTSRCRSCEHAWTTGRRSA